MRLHRVPQATLALLLLACPERDRIAGPSGGIGIGPEVTITDPAQDVNMTAGTSMLIKGTAFDEEGIDSIFFTKVNAPDAVPPIAAGGVVHATFSIPVDLVGAAGDTITVAIYASNLQHVRGDLVTRRIRLH